MLRRFSTPSFLILLILITFPLHSQVPDGGTRLNAETGNTWDRIGNCTVTEVEVQDQPFSRALRVVTGGGLSNSWDAQLKFPAVAGVETGDAVLVAFYARTVESQEETGEGFLNVIIEHNQTYAKQISQPVSIGSDWKEYYASAEMGASLATSEVSYLFHMGFSHQTVEVADVRYLNYGTSVPADSLPVTEISYVGRDPDAEWRVAADERIALHRMGPAVIRVVDSAGNPVPGAGLEIAMQKHSFGFGTAVTARRITTDATYRDTLFHMFNEVVFENDLKWPQFINLSNRNILDHALDTLHQREMPVRGHTIIWPSWDRMPGFTEDLAGKPEELRAAIDAHFDEVTAFTRGRVVDWDVMNEPYTENEVMDVLGDEVMADWFKRTRRNDRNVQRYINEYAIVSAGGKNRPKQDFYFDLIREIDSLGGDIDGIGMQGHMSGDLTPIPRVYEIIDRFAALGKEIKITEHDVNLDQRQRAVQADYTRDFMTIVFSHPSVKSLLVWGFWAGAHWRPEAAFYNTDWSIRPHGLAWKQNIRERWWTPGLDTVTGDQGEVSLEGFLGTYSYTVRSGETERTGTFVLDQPHAGGHPDTFLLCLDPAIPEEVRIVPDPPGYLCQGEEVVLHAPEGEGLVYAWSRNGEALPDTTASLTTGEPGSYSVTVRKEGITLTAPAHEVEVRPLPDATLTPLGETAICQGDSVVLEAVEAEGMEYEWYRMDERQQWGGSSFTTFNIGSFRLKATLNGCTAESDNVVITALPGSECTTGIDPSRYAARIWPNPASGTVRVGLTGAVPGDSHLELYDTRGRLHLERPLKAAGGPVTLTLPGPGIYILKVHRAGGVENHRLVSL